MSSAQIKEIIKAQLEDADERLLKMIHAMMEAYHDDSVFGYDAHGNPTSISDAKERYKNAIEKAKNGEYTTLDKLKTKSEEWMKRSK